MAAPACQAQTHLTNIAWCFAWCLRSNIRALGRAPGDGELASAVEFLRAQAASYPAEGAQLALADFCQTVVSMNEFVYVE